MTISIIGLLKRKINNLWLQKHRNGFTLIEMIVVIVIIGVLTAFSVPYFGGFANRTKLESTCRSWMAMANYARSQAVMNGVNYRMTCDLDQQNYMLTYESTSTGVEGQYVSPTNEWGQLVTLDSTIRMDSIQLDQNPPQTSGVAYIDFTPRGTTNDVDIWFRNKSQDEQEITIAGITGLVKIISSDTTS